MTIELTYNNQTFTYPNLCLTELPFAFEDSDVKRGRTAETLNLNGLLLRADAESIVELYRLWRDDKIIEEDPKKTGVVGAVITVTGDGIGFDWIDRSCWFSKAPEITNAGIYARVSISLVDAEQSLEIYVEEDQDSEEAGIDFGTLTLGGAIITLTSYPNSYERLPQIDVNPTGRHVISGTLSLDEVKEVEGWVSGSDLTLLTTWLNSTVGSTPVANTYFPIGFEKPVAKNRTINNAVVITYDIRLKLIKIKG